MNYHKQPDVYEGISNKTKITVTITNKMSRYSKVSKWSDQVENKILFYQAKTLKEIEAIKQVEEHE